MNERIKELEKQSYVTFKDENSFECLVFSKEKFAELIVKECVNNVKVWEKDSRNHISYLLKRHFGVEE